jgi:HlyD family secretion protein
MNLKLSFQPKKQWMIGLVVAATAVTGGIAYYGLSQSGIFAQSKPNPTVEAAPIVPKVTALGRLQPEEEIIKLSVSKDLDGDRISQLLVKEGDTVKAGQVVAIMDSRNKLQDALKQAEKQVIVASSKLAQVKAGAKRGDIAEKQAGVERFQAQWVGDRVTQQEAIARLEAQLQGEKAAQEATIRKIEAEVNNAKAEFQRYEQLYKEGAISSSLYDTKRLSLDTTRQQLSEAKASLTRINATGGRQISEAKATLTRINATSNKQLSEAKVALNRIEATGSKQVTEAKGSLSSVAEIRLVDVQAGQAEVESAVAAQKRAKTDLEAAYIRAPTPGQIIKIHSRPGEKISTSGIADMAETQQMIAVAEVYQSDIAKVKSGQKAVITGQGFTGELQGTVYLVGLQVSRQNVFSNEPGENLDSRVVEVKIRLNPEDAKKVSGLSNLQVQTTIEL